ncbi:MAG: serine/threonine-protein kinase, partial [Phycisphaerales bacterium]|nr:serine/threonine-protein kinase [Phycisphaerales bacterium]
MNEDKPRDNSSDPDAETLESQPQHARGVIPSEIGRYKVQRTIGSGGMGTVYQAIQESPRRKVAIKVMRSGVTSKSAMRRFEYESQILGRLSHRCIAQVYEAGTYDDGTGGVPYFAMEYIVGAKTLLDYAKQKDLKVHERLELFEQVCDAVHHGHLKGIIHRDLKPDNILVDSAGNPKIIDFGVARSTDSDMVVTTLQTNVGQLIGTVQYMSPEQCEADPDLIDARSDVYSLGVILYELLTGQPPYDLSSIPIYEATRLIREQQPTKMTTIAEGIQGDLETVVSKAIDKDRDRRYQSSYELGQDITRFLENEPIHARRASLAYQIKMFARRNKAMVATVMTIAIALVITTTVSIYAGILASQAEAKAIVERDRAVVAEEQVAEERDRAIGAEAEAKDALAIAKESQQKTQEAMEEREVAFKMMLSVAKFNEDLLALGAPRNSQGEELSVHDILLFATTEISERFGHEPNLEAPARKLVGTLLWEMGDLENARVELKRSVDLFRDIPGDARKGELVEVLTTYANLLLDVGEFEKAREIIGNAIDEGVRVPYLGLDSPEVLKAKIVLANIIAFGLTLESSEEALELGREVMVAINGGAGVSREFELEAKTEFANLLMTRHSMGGRGPATMPLLEESMELIEETLPVLSEEFGDLHPAALKAG